MGMEKKVYELRLSNNELITITDIKEIAEDGTLPLVYIYKGKTPREEIDKLLTEKINELLEKAIYGEYDA